MKIHNLLKKTGFILLLISSTLTKTQSQTYLPYNYFTFEQANAMTDSMGHGNINPAYYASKYSIQNNQPSTGIGKYINYPKASGLMIGPQLNVDTAITFECMFRATYDFHGCQMLTMSNNQMVILMHYPYISFGTSYTLNNGSVINDIQYIYLTGTNKANWGYYIDGNWHHLVFRVNVRKGLKELWVDGELPTGFSKTISAGTFNTATNYTYFSTSYAGGELVSDLDEIAFYKYELPPNMIAKHAQNAANHQHYSFAYSSTPPTTALPVTAGIDINEYPPGHPTVTVSAIDQLNTYPAPRYKQGHTLMANNPVVNYLGFGGVYQPGVTDAQARWNSVTIQKQLFRNFNYAISLASSGTYYAFNDTASYTGACVKLANDNPTISTCVLSYWQQLKPTDAGYKNGSPYASCGCLQNNNYLQNASGNFIDANGSVTATKSFAPDALQDSVVLDGLTQRFYMNKLLQALTRPLTTIFENGEVIPYYVTNTAGIAADASVATDKTNSGLDWNTYLGNRFTRTVKTYRDQFMNLGGLANTKFTFYQIDGEDGYHPKYSECRNINTPINGMNYATGDIYVRWPDNWLTGWGAWHGWEWVIKSRLKEISLGDKLFSPTVSPGWDVNEENNLRPSQWLGFLKAVSMTGAEFFATGFFGTYPANKPQDYMWQMVMPSYAQAITSRYEDLLRNGSLMSGDQLSATGAVGYTFAAGYGDKRKLVVVRKHNTLTKYAITGTIQPSSNMIGATELEGMARINLDGQYVKFKVRRQGSTYIYDKTNVAEPVFYQLDAWHETSHPYRWSQDFNIEGELFDNTNAQLQIKTSVPAGTVAGDYSVFTSYVAFNAATNASYNFAVRGNASATYYLWVRARSKDGSSTGFSTLMDGTTSNQISCITDTNWVWYRLNSANLAAITYSNLIVGNHTLSVTSLNDKLYIDQVILTKTSGAVYGTASTSCGAVATITASGSTSLCPGGSVILTANTGTTYLWSNGANTKSITVSTAGTFVVTVTTSGTPAISAPVAVTLGSAPVIAISTSKSPGICIGDSILLVATPGSQYLWSPGNKTSQERYASAIGTYTVTVTNAAGCTGSATVDITNGNCSPSCQIPAGLTTSNITASGAKINWTAISGVYQYYYYFKNKSTGAITTGYVAQNTPNKTLTGLTANTSYGWKVRTYCTSTTRSAFSSTISFTTPTARLGDDTQQANQTSLEDNSLWVFPNPASDLVHVVVNNVTDNSNYKLEIFDVTGKSVYTADDYLTIQNDEFLINTSAMQTGIYMIRVTSDANTSMSKLIVK